MRPSDNVEDATQLSASPRRRTVRRRRFWRGGLIETLAALRFRNEARYAAWLEERDLVAIAAALSRLTDRQLGRIGLSRPTLVIGVEDLMRLADRNGRIGDDALRMIEGADTEAADAGTTAADRPGQTDGSPDRPIAAA